MIPGTVPAGDNGYHAPASKDDSTEKTHFYNNKNDTGVDMKKWQCFFCSYIYDEALGAPEDGIAPGTAWADVSPDWICPECGATKDDFAMLEIA